MIYTTRNVSDQNATSHISWRLEKVGINTEFQNFQSFNLGRDFMQLAGMQKCALFCYHRIALLCTSKQIISQCSFVVFL